LVSLDPDHTPPPDATQWPSVFALKLAWNDGTPYVVDGYAVQQRLYRRRCQVMSLAPPSLFRWVRSRVAIAGAPEGCTQWVAYPMMAMEATWIDLLGAERATLLERASLVAHWLSDILTELDALHRAGVIHADLRPDNCMVLQGRSGVVDFDGAFLVTVEPSDAPHHVAVECSMAADPMVASLIRAVAQDHHCTLGTPQYHSLNRLRFQPRCATDDLISACFVALSCLNVALPHYSHSLHPSRVHQLQRWMETHVRRTAADGCRWSQLVQLLHETPSDPAALSRTHPDVFRRAMELLAALRDSPATPHLSDVPWEAPLEEAGSQLVRDVATMADRVRTHLHEATGSEATRNLLHSVELNLYVGDYSEEFYGVEDVPTLPWRAAMVIQRAHPVEEAEQPSDQLSEHPFHEEGPRTLLTSWGFRPHPFYTFAEHETAARHLLHILGGE